MCPIITQMMNFLLIEKEIWSYLFLTDFFSLLFFKIIPLFGRTCGFFLAFPTSLTCDSRGAESESSVPAAESPGSSPEDFCPLKRFWSLFVFFILFDLLLFEDLIFSESTDFLSFFFTLPSGSLLFKDLVLPESSGFCFFILACNSDLSFKGILVVVLFPSELDFWLAFRFFHFLRLPAV